MAYRKINTDIKIKAITRVLCGERVTAVASEMGINRNSLALWKKRAIEAMRKDFTLNKHSVKRQRKGHRDKLQNVKNLVKKQERSIKQLRASLKTLRNEPRPSRCLKCGCERFYKNGVVRLQLEHILKVSRNGLAQDIPVQKFICVNCGHATHLEGPAALYYWAVSSVSKMEER